MHLLPYVMEVNYDITEVNIPSDIRHLGLGDKQPFSKMDINLYKISEHGCLDPKFGTWKVFGTIKPSLASDFGNFQISVNYNAMYSGQKSSKILRIGKKISENRCLDPKSIMTSYPTKVLKHDNLNKLCISNPNIFPQGSVGWKLEDLITNVQIHHFFSYETNQNIFTGVFLTCHKRSTSLWLIISKSIFTSDNKQLFSVLWGYTEVGTRGVAGPQIFLPHPQPPRKSNLYDF